MRTGPILLSMLAALLGTVAPVAPAGSEEVPGRTLVEERCARCHAIEKTGESPFALAPPLRDLEKRYPLESLEEAFAEGIVVGHPAMPEFEFEPEEIADLVAYLKWLGE
jgi:mono/diheme cytochrome c family protein